MKTKLSPTSKKECKASDIEKNWNKDLERRGVFEPKESSWEEEFDNLIKNYFDRKDNIGKYLARNVILNIDIKQFISHLLQSEREKFLNQPANQHDNEVRKLEREKIIKWAKDQWEDDAILPEDLINFLK